jgi:hypothetical protein
MNRKKISKKMKRVAKKEKAFKFNDLKALNLFCEPYGTKLEPIATIIGNYRKNLAMLN